MTKNNGSETDIDRLLRQQQERLANKPDDLADKIRKVADMGTIADRERDRVRAEEAANGKVEGIITAWIPEADPHVRITVGKLAEECSELAKVCTRIAIQGIDALDPDTGRTNREELYRELADVMGAADILDIFVPKAPGGIDVMARREAKREGFLKWHGLLRDHLMKNADFRL